MASYGLYSPSPSPAVNATDLNELAQTYLVITSNQVTDSQLTTSLWLNALLGGICFLAFCILQRSAFPQHYRYRLLSRSVTVRPRPLPEQGWKSYWWWLRVALRNSEGEIMRSCGLDAVVMIKALSMGVKIFMPLALIGCGVLLPLHYKYRSFDNQDINRSPLMQLTIAALPRGSELMWVHFVLIVLYNCWVMWVLFARYKEFVICRQHYLVKGDDPNYWIAATRSAEAEYMKKKVRKLLAEINNVHEPKKGEPADEPPEPVPDKSLSPEPQVRDSGHSGIRAVVGKMGKVGHSLTSMVVTSWRSKGNPFQRSSHESYKPYADEHTPAGSPPVTSPSAVALGSQSWGLCHERSGVAGAASSFGLGSGGDNSQGQSPASASTAGGSGPGLPLSAQLLESSIGAAGNGANNSGGSSRRWSGSSGGASEIASAVKGLEAASGDLSKTFQMPSKPQSSKGKAAATAPGVVAPTHQTFNELQSISLQGAKTAPLPTSYSEQNSWPLMPKHMRTITEDSLEYRLDSLQGNSSRPSSRGGLLGSSTGHNRGSSAGTGELSVASPLSASSRTPVSTLSASLAAAGDSSSLGHRHSHSHSGGSGAAAAPAPGNAMMSPLSRTSSARQAVGESFGNGEQQQPSTSAGQDAATLSTRGSVESLGPCSVCTRITHNTSSGRSTPVEGGSSSTGPSSRQSSPVPGTSSRASSPETANTAGSSFVSVGNAATRDLSFGGMADLQHQQAQRRGAGRAAAGVTGISPDQVHLSGLGVVETPAATPQGPGPHARHGYQTSVDFGALHLEDLSRPDTPLSPEGGFDSPQPLLSRAARSRGDSASGRWSPFASSEQLASTIVSGGVGNVDNFWQVGVQRVRGVQSHPGQPVETNGSHQHSQQEYSNKQRFRRPGPGWQPPSAGGQPQQLHVGSSEQRTQQQLGEQDRTQPTTGVHVKSAAVMQSSIEPNGSSLESQPQLIATEALASSSRLPSLPSSTASTRVNSGTGLQGLHARAQRQRVMPHNISTGQGGPTGFNSSEPSPGHAAAGWSGTSWQHQGSKGSNSAATSNSGQSRMVSPFASNFVTPRDNQAVAGAAIGAGQEMIAPAPATMLLSPGPAVKTLADVVQQLQVVTSTSDDDDDERQQMPWDRSNFVVHPWWRELDPETQLEKYYENGRPIGMEWPQDAAWPRDTNLAKPSVRWRKTINYHNEKTGELKGVMAQHYAVLVTDVEQWPYPELQMAHEAARQRSLPYKAWQWVTTTLPNRVRRLTNKSRWSADAELPQHQEQQHLLLQLQQDGVAMSDKHLHDIADPLAAADMLDPAAAAGGTSGGASVVVSRSSRGHGRGQVSSCATSSEGFGGGAGAGTANSLARASLASHATQLSYLPTDPADLECLMAQADHKIALKKQEAMQSLDDPKVKKEAAQVLGKMDKFQDKLGKIHSQHEQQQQALSREQSAYHLSVPSRSASHMQLGPLAISGTYGQAGAVPGGWANQAASRASSFKSVHQGRAENAVAGAAVGVPDMTQKPQAPSNLPTRSQTPASQDAGNDAGAANFAGSGAGPLTRDRLDSALVLMHTHREQQLRRRHSALQPEGSFAELPRLQGASMLVRGSDANLAGFASAAVGAGMSVMISHSQRPLEQALSEPVTAGGSATVHILQQQLSHPDPQAGYTLISQPSPDATADTSVGGHPLLVGDLSLEQPTEPSSSIGGAESEFSAAADAAAGVAAATVAAAGAQGATADAVVHSVLRHHRRHVYRPALPSEGGREGLVRRAELARTPSPSAGSQVDGGDGGSWSSLPTSPEPGSAFGPLDAAGVAHQRLQASGTAVAADSRPQSRSAGGALAGAAGVSDSYESNASSYAARRPVVSFKPYPPDSPKLRHQQQGGFGSIVLVDGAATGSQSLRTSIATKSVGRLAGSGGSASYAPAPISLQAAGRSKSARLSCNLADGGMHPNGSFHHPDHLSLLIPPAQQMPISRVATPCGSSGGFAGSGGGLGGSGGGIPHVHLPPAPWGLPPDAALLTSSVGMLGTSACSPANAVLHGGSVRHRVSPAPPHAGRWSVTGMQAERSAGSVSHSATSPLYSNQTDGDLIPAIGRSAGQEPAGFSRAASAASGEAAMALQLGDQATDAKAAAGLEQEGDRQLLRRYRGWDLVRQAFREKLDKEGRILRSPDKSWKAKQLRPCRLTQLLQSDSYSVVTATFKRLFPEDFDKAIPVINHRNVDMLLMRWEAAVAELERAEAAQRRTGIPPTRFKGKLGEMLSCFSTVGCGFKRWRHHNQQLGTCCEEHVVEIIPEIMERMRALELQIEQARREAFRSSFTPSWFVLFKTQKAASIAASTRLYAEDNTRFQVHPAPGPEEVNWQHLWMDYKERDCRTVVTWPLMLLIVLFPITLVTSAASRLEYVFCPEVTPGDPTPAFVWEWYCTGKEEGSAVPSFIRALFTGWLPSLLLNLWLVMVLPRLVYLVVQAEGSCFSLSALERRIGAVFYLWDVFNVFLQGTIGSTFFQQVRAIIQTPDQLPNILGAALPDSSNFFMQFIAMRALFLVWLRLCMPHGGVWQNWCHFCFCPASCCSTCNTERDKSLTYGPRTPRYGFEMGHILLMYLIGLAFAIVSPLLMPFSVVWFMFAWVAWRHNLSYVYQRKYESGGLMWIFLFSRIVMCMVIGQMFTFCVLVVKGAYWQAFLTIAFLPAMTAKFYRYCQARFARGIEYGVPLDLADRAEKMSVPPEMYIPPPLQDRSWGWYPEWNKIWDGWGMPAYAAV